MRKFLVLIILIIICLPAKSQTEKGKFLIGMSTTLSSIGTGPAMGGFRFSSTKVEIGNNSANSRTYNINLVPRIGYCVKEDIVVGIDANFSYGHTVVEKAIQKETAIFGGLGCFGRFYYPKKRISPFIELNAGIGRSDIKELDHIYYRMVLESKSSFFDVGGGFGIAFPIGSKASFDILADYDFLYEMPDEKYYGREVRSFKHSVGVEMGFVIELSK